MAPLISAIGMGIAGILHFLVTPEHWAHAPAHGIVFLLLGLLQLLWAISFLKKRSYSVYRAGIILAAGSIFLWAITRIWTAPFESGPEAIELNDIAVKIFELISIAALLLAMRSLAPKPKAGRVSIWVISAFFLAAAAYAGGRMLGPVFPALGGTEGHGHKEHHH
ncbi:MAG: hypothetical protein PHE18_02840 [Candidatus Omnitrophica bacterium]|nr:hypothetical protein [Candidatus Omnitrophota bacterium]